MNPDIQKAFHEAVKKNDVETARRMIAAGADINAPYDEYENRSFLDACYSGNLDLVKMLAEAGADVNLPDSCGTVPLVRAIVSWHDTDAVLNYLIERGADVNGKDRSMSLPLHVAVSENDIKIAALLLTAGAIPNVEDDEGKNALFEAVENGNEKMLRLLLAHGADVNHVDDDGNTPLSLSCIKGNENLCKLLLERGANCDSKDYILGNTVLMEAVEGGNPNCVKLILSQGVDVNEENCEFDTALSLTVFYGMSLDIIEQLLDAGADPNAELAWSKTPLSLAVRERNFNAVRLLLRRGACFNTPSEYYDDSVLNHADDHLLYKSMISKGYSIRTDDEAVILYAKHACSYLLRKSLESGANPNAVDAAGKSALTWALEHPRHPQGCAVRLIRHGAKFNSQLIIYAVRKRMRELLHTLIEAGADVNVTDGRGNSALHYAIRSNRAYLVRDLIKAGAELDMKNANNYTPLLLAICHRCYASANLLLELGANKRICGGKHNEDAYRTSERYQCSLCGNKLKRQPWDTTAKANLVPYRFYLAALAGDSEKIKNLVDEGYDINAYDNFGYTALHRCVEYERGIDELISNGADMYAETMECTGDTPAPASAIAAAFSQFDNFLKFLECGYDVNHIDSQGMTLLMHCAANDWEAGARALLKRGADPSIRDISGRTALFYVCSFHDVCYSEIIDILLEYGADINSTDNEGNTALLRIADKEVEGDRTHLDLIARGIDVNIRNNAGETALSIARKHGHSYLISELLAAGAIDN